jgi:NAD(P)-dependent dehydrogenase (short-subunit alcohol dehydrogenase family)
VVGTVVVTNAFLPLIEKGAQKKVINISSAAGDSEFVEKTGYASAAYGISKAALNYINTKYATEFRGKGHTFLAISPGLVKTRLNHGGLLLPPSFSVEVVG